MARLYNVTDSEVVTKGTTSCSVNDITTSSISCTVALDEAKTFRVEHQCQTTNATDGFGLAAGFAGTTEQYTSVTIRYLGK